MQLIIKNEWLKDLIKLLVEDVFNINTKCRVVVVFIFSYMTI